MIMAMYSLLRVFCSFHSASVCRIGLFEHGMEGMKQEDAIRTRFDRSQSLSLHVQPE